MTDHSKGTMAGRKLSSLLGMAGICLLTLILCSSSAQAQVPPEVVNFIDLKCYRITNVDGFPLDPLNIPLRLDHLNPLFTQITPPPSPEDVTVLDPFQLCVPVAKNGMVPPATVIDFVKYLDLKCYNIADPSGLPLPPLGLRLMLTHLNQVLLQMGAQPEVVTMFEPRKLCVPVAKNGVLPPTGSPALNFISNVDQKCYNIGSNLNLMHLNPVLQDQPREDVRVIEGAQQLCVPVMKNQTPPPSTVIDAVSNVDLKCYAITDQSGNPLLPLGVTLRLTHLNPVILGTPGVLPDETVLVQEPQQLCVPVGKSLPPTPAAPSGAKSPSRTLAGKGAA